MNSGICLPQNINLLPMKNSLGLGGRRPVIYDTTLRDGEQTPGVELLLPEKLQITQLLDDYGIGEIEGGFPVSSRADMEYFKRVKELDLRASVFAFGRAAEKDIEAMIEAEPDGFTLVGKADLRQVSGVLRKNAEEYLVELRTYLKQLKRMGKPVYFDAEHFFDGYKYNTEYALDVLKAAHDADILVLCDTNGGSFPDEIEKTIKEVAKQTHKSLGFHAHNDAGFADANTWIAYRAGCMHIQGTVNRLGERCGNANILSFICNLYREGIDTGVKILKTTELSKAIEVITGFRVPHSEPFVGMNAGAHSGGMHADGMEKMKAYEFFDLRIVGNRVWYPFSRVSGSATIVSEAARYGIYLSKKDAIVKELLANIEETGKVGDAQFYLLLNRKTNRKPEPFKILKRTNIDIFDPARELETTSEVTLYVDIRGKTEHVAGEGDGPVHAVDEALRNALRKYYPDIDKAELLFYDVVAKRTHVERGTAASVDVYVEFSYNGQRWTSLARHPNIIRASEIAISDAQKYFLMWALNNK